MDKKDYYLHALKQGAYLKKKWIYTTFARTRLPVFDKGRMATYYPFELFLFEKESKRIGFLNPDTQDLELLPDATAGEPLVNFKDRITITSADIPNLHETSLNSTYGMVLLNWILAVYPVGTKIPFVQGKTKGDLFESHYKNRLADNVAPGVAEDPAKIYVHEYLKFQGALDYLGQFNQVFCPAASENSITPNKEVLAYRNQLVKEAGATISDPVVLSILQAKVAAKDKELMKGDDSEEYLIGKKDYSVVRMKLMYMYGLEGGFGEKKVIKTSLYEGMNLDNLPAMANATREGSINRGLQTALGGVEVKRANQIFQAVVVKEFDCGFNSSGKLVYVGKEENVIGRYVIDKGKAVLVTPETAKGYLGNIVLVRTPSLCKTAAPDYCEVCVGTHLSTVKDGLHVGVANVSSIVMYAFMGANHGKALATEYYDINLTWS